MQIVNFKKHETAVPIKTPPYLKGKFQEIAQFDIQFNLKEGDFRLVWQGWSVRLNEKQKVRLQAPLLMKSSSAQRSAVFIEGMDFEVFRKLLVNELEQQYGIKIGPPTPRKQKEKKKKEEVAP
jgi:hypothetical protein